MTLHGNGVGAVLFDLDGTLVDTAGDLGAAANRMLERRALPPKPIAQLRPQASHGARGLLGVAFGVTPESPDYEALRVEFLETYEKALCVESRLFDTLDRLLARMEANHLPWGIVTNKVARFTLPLLKQLDLATRAACVVCGDTTPHTKPHPAPMFEAARLAGVPAASCIYVGDDARDVAAGNAAGMQTIAASYGYCGDSDPSSWHAGTVIDTPAELTALIETTLKLA
jgi:phosphoglycolate phosphatase